MNVPFSLFRLKGLKHVKQMDVRRWVIDRLFFPTFIADLSILRFDILNQLIYNVNILYINYKSIDKELTCERIRDWSRETKIL